MNLTPEQKALAVRAIVAILAFVLALLGLDAGGVVPLGAF